MQLNIPHKKIFIRLMMLCAASAILPLCVMAILFTAHQERSEKNLAEAHLQEMAAERADAVTLFLMERINLLAVLASISTSSDLSSPEMLKDRLALLNHGEKYFTDLGLLDENANQYAYSGPYALSGHNYSQASWFAQAMFRGSLFSDLLMGVRKVPHFILAVRRDEGKTSHLIRATMNPEALDRLLAPLRTGETGDAFIVNSEGLFQTSPRLGGELMADSGIRPRNVPPGVTSSQRLTRDGRTVISAFARIPGQGWLLVVEKDPGEGTSASPARMSIAVLVLIMAGMLSAGLMAFFIYRAASSLLTIEKRKAEADERAAHSARLGALGRMAAGIAHEINNPLAAIGNSAGILDDLADETFTEDTPNADQFREHTRKIISLVNRAGEITRRMLGFARRMEPKIDTINLNDLLRETVSYLEKDALYRNIEIDFRLDSDQPKIQTDRALVQQVFLTLVNNAMDAVEQNGHIWIESRYSGGNFVEVMVGDDGPGMDKYTLAHIFEPFFTTKSPGKGTGLGLSVAFSIVEGLGGRLSAASLPGEGARFTVRLPLSSGV
ncbi:MAG: hypothetical protein HZB23_12275 [Deltaproteobacteria bacterium]|nr:hypothetical protein [Deltaproteobacteria bacterium]